MNIKLNFGDTHSEVVELTPAFLADDIIQQAVTHWSLPVDQNYNLVNVTKQKVIPPNAPLSFSNIEEGDVLQITPIIVAG
ncbi:MAG TPA: hypothetical protein PLO92_08390 [Anaerolineaceae bacterium]|jgi:hypothetical protein|nr:hypothetical protein [Anaerolineaceae bacterium]HQC21830.1 hypothetical protein [Anaerolineaceae bacterium]